MCLGGGEWEKRGNVRRLVRRHNNKKMIIINYYLPNTSFKHGPAGANRKTCSVLAGKVPGGGLRQEALLGLKDK